MSEICTECKARLGVRVDGDDLCACVECRTRMADRKREQKDTDPEVPSGKRRFESRLREG